MTHFAETLSARADPSKRLFLSLLTRDISLEDAILDLIDNSINSAIRIRNLKLVENFDDFISARLTGGQRPSEINIVFSSEMFEIHDNCGGIPFISARDFVFRFGRDEALPEGDVLSVYGVGLKRALFKIGDHIHVSSQDSDSAFIVEDHARDWASRPEIEWKFPLREVPRDTSKNNGTHIVLRDILSDVKGELADPAFERRLVSRMGQTYCFFIDTVCTVTINGRSVPSVPLSFGSWERTTPQIDRLKGGGCEIRLIAGLAPRNLWAYEHAGWYIFCNGRNVLAADKSPTTGWGVNMPLYMSKFRGFRGLAFFFAQNPEDLPWTTTKTEINKESAAYKLALTSMSVAARPSLTFLNSLYQDDEVEQAKARSATERMVEKTVVELLPVKEATFSTVKLHGPRKVRVQYDVTVEELIKVRKHRGRSTESAKKIGRMTFEYYLKHEGI